MKEDIRKNIVDESGKNSDNIVDIEGFATEYEADAEFENLIKNGLDESWEDLGLSVSDDLIARTMDAIRNADANAKALPGTEAPAKAATAGTEIAVEPVKTRNVRYRRFARIAAGIAAAALIGLFGIGVLKSGLFFSKKSADGAARGESASNSAPMSMASKENGSATKSDNSKTDAPASDAGSILDIIGQDSTANESFSMDSMITEAAAASFGEDGTDGNSFLQNVEPMATAVPDINTDNGTSKTMEPVAVTGSDITTDTDEIEADAGMTGDGTGNIFPAELPGETECGEDALYTPTADDGDSDLDSRLKQNTAYLDIDAVLLDTDEEEQAQTLIEYIESVRGELLDTAVDTSYPEDKDAILFSAVWPETDTESVGLFMRCDIYDDRVVYSHGSFLDHIAPDFTVEEYMLEDGETVAAELIRLSGGASE